MSEMPPGDLIDITEPPRDVAPVDALRVLIVDDDPAGIAALQTKLEDLDITIVGSTDSVEHALDLATTLDPHVAVIRWNLSSPISKTGPSSAGAMALPRHDRGAVLDGVKHR